MPTPINCSISFASLLVPWPSVTIEQETSEKVGEVVVRVEWEDVRNELIRANDNNCARFAVDPAQVEDVLARRRLGAYDRSGRMMSTLPAA